MCIISDYVDTVKFTKILAFPSKNGKRQLTVYSNIVSTPNSNVMCLPVPNPRSVRFEYVPSDIFSQCSKSFNIRNARCGEGCMDSFSSLYNSTYKAIVVNSINELNCQNGFILTFEVIEFLKATYPNFGFILCKLKKGNVKYKPFAYSHDIENTLFFPTRHYHISIKEEPVWTSFDYVNLNESKANHIADDWDHELYSIATPRWCHESTKVMQHSNKINWDKMPNDFNLNSYVILRCNEKYGYNPNIDIEMPFQLSLIY